jgi:folate-binding protein YgfZ
LLRRPRLVGVTSSALLSLPGAVAAEAPDDGVAWHYGDPLREQRQLAEHVGWVDRGNRGVLRITGPDRHSWLHSLTTQTLDPLPAGRGAEALVLSPQGHVEHHLVLADDGTTTWLDVEPYTAESLVAFLASMQFMLRVEVADVSDDVHVLSVIGPGMTAALDAIGVSVGPAAYDVVTSDGVVVRRMPWPGEDAADLLVPRTHVAAVVDALGAAGATPAGAWAFDALRVAARRPRLHVDTDHRTLPHEVGWIETAVQLDKGCYRGQETVARVHNLGRPPRRLVLLHLDGSSEALPARGAHVTANGDDVGFVGTAVRHYELGPVAFALIRRATPLDAEVTVDGQAATAEVVVDPDVGLHIKPTLR